VRRGEYQVSSDEWIEAEKHMKKKISLLTLCAALLTLCVSAPAQQPKKVPRVGYLTTASLSAIAQRTEAFRQGLRELGYIEGKNIVIEWRSPEGEPDRTPTLAAELVRLKVNVIVTGGGGATRPLKEATSTIPIVMAQDRDPVANGFVASLARPGGNITGLSTLSPEISGKQLELLKEIVSRFSRVAVLGTTTSQGYAQVLREVGLAAGALGVQPQYLNVSDPRKLTLDSEPQARGVLTQSLWWGALSSILSEHRLRPSR
jgi:putative tryptophan/tyrosine transport system substrate-binding protein